MIVGAYVEHAAPEHAAGAEWSLQDTLSWLALKGHDCRVLARKGYREPAMVDGVHIRSRPGDDLVVRHFQECDVMLTQLDATMDAQLLAMTYQTPLVQLLHSETQVERFGVMPSCSALLVPNSNQVAATLQGWPGLVQLLHPVVDARRVHSGAEPGQCVTLVNLSHNKGAQAFVNLAKRNEHIPFMGVQGGYDTQVLGPEGFPGNERDPTPTGLPQNVRVFGSMEIADVFRYTRVLLVLSLHETYGRVAAEAMVNGIPVIAARTPGLVECCGDSAQYVEDRDSLVLDMLVRDTLTEPLQWEAWSDAAKHRTRVLQLNQVKQLRGLEKALLQITLDPPEMTL